MLTRSRDDYEKKIAAKNSGGPSGGGASQGGVMRTRGGTQQAQQGSQTSQQQQQGTGTSSSSSSSSLMPDDPEDLTDELSLVEICSYTIRKVKAFSEFHLHRDKESKSICDDGSGQAPQQEKSSSSSSSSSSNKNGALHLVRSGFLTEGPLSRKKCAAHYMKSSRFPLPYSPVCGSC